MLLRHSLLYLLARGLPGIIGFVTLAVYTRLLPPEQYGRYALVLAGVSLGNAILFQWLRLGLLRYLPAYGDRPAPLLATLLTGYAAMAALGLAFGGLAVVFAPDAAWRSLVLLAVLLLWAEAWHEINLTLLRSQLAPARYGVLALTKSVLALAGGTGLILLGLGATGPLLALTVAMLVPSLVFARAAWRGLGWPRPAPGLVQELLAYGLPLTATVALNFVISSSDRFLLAWLLGTEAAGTYAAGYDLGWVAVNSLMLVVNLAGYPLVMRAMESAGPGAAQVQLRQNGLLLLAVALPALVLSVMLAPNLARVVLGAPFRAEGASLLPWIALAAFLAGARLYYANLAFQLSRRTLGQLWVSLAAALLNLGLNWLWIPRFGLLGAAWATVAAYGLALVLGWWLGRRMFPLPMLPVHALKPLGAVLVMALALWPCRAWLGHLALAAQVGVGLLIYALALVLLDLTFGRGGLLRLLRGGGRSRLDSGPVVERALDPL
jgi:O-antigen/teichoic acid export membrane protein